MSVSTVMFTQIAFFIIAILLAIAAKRTFNKGNQDLARKLLRHSRITGWFPLGLAVFYTITKITS
jgi:hypothetical protein